MGSWPDGKRHFIYECQDCGWVESDFVWDATDLEEKGPPACPQSHQHGQTDMQPIEVVPAAALSRAEQERDQALEAIRRARDECAEHGGELWRIEGILEAALSGGTGEH